ncbi:protein ABHD11-like [Paramacrobiotus metropolitanus]|uniref:protein ABHD11-like n=1 Tax=Paramacrobiotus metropolitanus TaxID=2943436 RepID=UPI0024461377|nr:protein ABHD11-like [Paramacrobiotus metropolitanus]
MHIRTMTIRFVQRLWNITHLRSAKNLLQKNHSACSVLRIPNREFSRTSIRQNASTTTVNGADRPQYTPVKLATKSWKPEGELAQLAAKSKCPVYLTHGLLGYKEEFDPLAQEIANRTGHVVTALDARNHGESQHADRIDYIALADDLTHYLREQRVDEAIFVGHSMGAGGLLALTFRKPEVIKGMFLIDAAVIDVPRKQQLSAFLRGLQMLQFDPTKTLEENRRMAADILKYYEVETFLIDHRVLPNIVEKDGITHWRVNIDVFVRDVMHLTRAPPEFADFPYAYKGPLHIMVSNASGYISPVGKATTKEIFPQVEYQHVDGAGHWIHIDQPELFLKSVIAFINNVDKDS